MKKVWLLLALCSLSCVGETVDKLIFEDWIGGEVTEENGKIVLRPRLVFVLVDESGKVTEVNKQIWIETVLN